MRIENFSDEELKLELRKRANKRKEEAASKRKYKTIFVEAEVLEVDNVRFRYKDGSVKYYPLLNWIYLVKIGCIKQGDCQFEVRLSQKIKKADAPKVGDKVLNKCSVRYNKNGSYNYQVGRVHGICPTCS